MTKDQLDAERFRALVRHANCGFAGAPSWAAVIRLPVLSHADQSIAAVVDRLRIIDASNDGHEVPSNQ
jgi:hypothetical protein